MKTILLSFYLLLLAGFASAQCNPQFTATASPNGNSLLRFSLGNTTAHTWVNTQYPIFSYLQTSAGMTYTGSSNPYPGTTNYVTFSTPGTYQVALAMWIIDSLTGNRICADTSYQTITVTYPSCGTTISYTTATLGTYSFTASTPAGTSGMTYSWNFGDGSTGTGSNPTHTYAANGVYTVTVVASSPGCSYTNTITVVVATPINCSGNNAQFTTAVSGATVTFSNLSPAPPSTGIHASYLWEFGDGSISMLSNPVHTYSTSGTYNISLISIWNDSLASGSCRDTAIQSLSITAPPPPPLPNFISGIVIRPDTTTSSLNDPMRVWLISYNQATNMLQAIDSITVDSAYRVGSRFFNDYWFTNVASGSYLLKAARIGGAAGSYGPIPTYHDSSYYWNSATPITVAGGTSNNNGFIVMRMGIVSSGPGFIGGNVSLGANRGTASGVPGMVILLRNSISNIVYRSAITDANGDYSFPAVPTGLYSIYPEDLGYTTTPRTNIAITNAQNNVQAINFNEDRSNRTIKPRGTSVAAINANGAIVVLYPNPAKGNVTISWKGLSGKSIAVSIANITGQVVLNQHTGGSANGSILVDIARLQPGIYTVRLHTEAGDAVQKLVVQP